MSKKSNNKGYFLAETIVVIALVTSVMAYVFPNVTKVYDNYNNRSKYYDQTEDVYLLKAIAEYYQNLTISNVYVFGVGYIDISYMGYLTYDKSNVNLNTYPDNTGAGCKNQDKFSGQSSDNVTGVSGVSGLSNGISFPSNPITFTNNTNYKTSDGYQLEKLYITGYLNSPTASNNYNFNKYLNRLKKNTSDSSSYRLIGVFKKDNSERYASIKVDNPNPKRNCNLGG